MRLGYVIFSLLLSTHGWSVSWKVAAENLADESRGREARAQLLKVKSLDRELEKALGSGSADERLALSVIAKLPRPSLVPKLLQLTKSMDVTEVRSGVFYMTLLSLVDGVRGKEILNTVATRFDLTAVQVPSSLRITLLDAFDQQHRLPDPEVLSKLLDDPSYELRLKVMEVIPDEVRANPDRFLSLLQKAITIGPYPVRLRALEMIELFSKTKLKVFEKAILSCAQKDPSEVVKAKCLSLKTF